ncbi:MULTISPECIES: hypothetical protein [Halomonas]|uniref:Uncharacterized protein n=1 Tax=Halomonas ventosae TaxID=229007 RepID=A0A4R6HCL6_9GAMM|nr:hypothetical protein [Halomonas ventosae]TDO06200.1 hypothetical protein DFO68_11116 [Halomonas ventosae]
MALFLLVLVICLVIFGGMIALLMLSGTPRYRTEPEHMLELFDKALESRVGETEWNVIIGYPIRHDNYLDGIRRRAQRLMDEHGRHGRVSRGKALLDATGQEELAALRDHLAAHTSLQRRQD